MELVRGALRQEFANPEERLEAAGSAGAPFSYANAVRACAIKLQSYTIDKTRQVLKEPASGALLTSIEYYLPCTDCLPYGRWAIDLNRSPVHSFADATALRPPATRTPGATTPFR